MGRGGVLVGLFCLLCCVSEAWYVVPQAPYALPLPPPPWPVHPIIAPVVLVPPPPPHIPYYTPYYAPCHPPPPPCSFLQTCQASSPLGMTGDALDLGWGQNELNGMSDDEFVGVAPLGGNYDDRTRYGDDDDEQEEHGTPVWWQDGNTNPYANPYLHRSETELGFSPDTSPLTKTPTQALAEQHPDGTPGQLGDDNVIDNVEMQGGYTMMHETNDDTGQEPMDVYVPNNGPNPQNPGSSDMMEDLDEDAVSPPAEDMGGYENVYWDDMN